MATDSGSDLPGLQLPCLNEESRIDLTALGQRPTLINLWATWCGPCRKEMPRLARAAQANQSVQFLGVNTKDDPELAAAFLAEAGVTFPQLVDIEGSLLDSTRIRGLPVTLAIDVDGRIVDRSIGEVSDAELATLIATLGNTS
ncbi:hypothetical protein ASE01_20280 [Nocardioides sp. Root190]|nr:hypothetical protein ASE01_20280 [Nocardioides sp. Root190]